MRKTIRSSPSTNGARRGLAAGLILALACACSPSLDGRAMPPGDGAGAAPPFADLLSAAVRDFAADGNQYAVLHHRYFGVTQPAPDTGSCPAWPATGGGQRTLRLGYVPEAPLHTVDAAGTHTGFEADLAVELVRRIDAHYTGVRIALEWAVVDIALPIGPAKNSTEVQALAGGLRAGAFDVAFSSVVPESVPDLAYLCPTMTMFPGVVYTGRDGLDVSGIHDRTSLVRFLAQHAGLTFVHGAGVSVYDALAADVASQDGSISLAPSGATPHFRMADIVGLSKLDFANGAQGTLLDVNPRTDAQPRAAFALAP